MQVSSFTSRTGKGVVAGKGGAKEGWGGMASNQVEHLENVYGLLTENRGFQLRSCVLKFSFVFVEKLVVECRDFKGLPILVCFYSFRFVLRFLKFSVMVW